MKEYELKPNEKKIKFKMNTGNITIYRDNILVPKLYYGENLEVEEKDNGIKVSQKSGNDTTIRIGGMVINSASNISIVSGSNITIVNGKIVSGNVTTISNCGSDETEDVEFVIPRNVNDLSFDVSSNSGSLIVRNSFIESIEAHLMQGDILMEDVDMLYAKLKTMCGDIKLDIANSILNYNADLNAMCGRVKQDHIDSFDNNNINIAKRRELKATTMCGDVKVLYKG